MSLKNWILHKMNGLSTRADLPRSPVLRAGAVASPAVIRRNATRASLGSAPGTAAPATPDRSWRRSWSSAWMEVYRAVADDTGPGCGRLGNPLAAV